MTAQELALNAGDHVFHAGGVCLTLGPFLLQPYSKEAHDLIQSLLARDAHQGRLARGRYLSKQHRVIPKTNLLPRLDLGARCIPQTLAASFAPKLCFAAGRFPRKERIVTNPFRLPFRDCVTTEPVQDSLAVPNLSANSWLQGS